MLYGVVFRRVPNIHWQQAIFIRSMNISRAELYKKCYRILGIDDSSDQNIVRRAYIELVKKVHPDSGLPEADANRFYEIDKAFKLLQEKFAKNRRGIYEDEEEKVFDIQHTAPQHRQYLSFDGIGIGNPFQRQKQYQQVKAMKAQNHVMNHRIEKAQAGEKCLIPKEGFYQKHVIKTKYGFDRVVEDLIQEAISKGDFNNLRGTGKPLTTAQTQNPYLDFTTHKLNKILQDNGFTPEWITLQRDIRSEIKKIKSALREARSAFGDYPFSSDLETAAWNRALKRFENDIKELNKNIDKYNLIVPMIDKQFFRMRLDSMAEKILSDPNALKSNQLISSKETSTSNESRKPQKNSDFLSFFTTLF